MFNHITNKWYLIFRKKIRLAMIDLNVIQCLVVYLKSEVVKTGIIGDGQKGEATYNPYLMEYGWALLMNLCLHEESRGAAFSIAPDILTCVVQMLHTRPPRDVSTKNYNNSIAQKIEIAIVLGFLPNAGSPVRDEHFVQFTANPGYIQYGQTNPNSGDFGRNSCAGAFVLNPNLTVF